MAGNRKRMCISDEDILWELLKDNECSDISENAAVIVTECENFSN
jgi:hypothetical protein